MACIMMMLIHLCDKQKNQKVLRHYLRGRMGVQCQLQRLSNGFCRERDKPEGNEKWRRRRGDGIIAETNEINKKPEGRGVETQLDSKQETLLLSDG